MKQLDAKIASALADLRAHPQFRTFVEWLKEDERAEAQRCIELDGVALHRAQGATKKVQDLLQQFENAPSVLNKFKQRQTG